MLVGFEPWSEQARIRLWVVCGEHTSRLQRGSVAGGEPRVSVDRGCRLLDTTGETRGIWRRFAECGVSGSIHRLCAVSCERRCCGRAYETIRPAHCRGGDLYRGCRWNSRARIALGFEQCGCGEGSDALRVGRAPGLRRRLPKAYASWASWSLARRKLPPWCVRTECLAECGRGMCLPFSRCVHRARVDDALDLIPCDCYSGGRVYICVCLSICGGLGAIFLPDHWLWRCERAVRLRAGHCYPRRPGTLHTTPLAAVDAHTRPRLRLLDDLPLPWIGGGLVYCPRRRLAPAVRAHRTTASRAHKEHACLRRPSR
ncbi:hypothetical protein B0H16DRAFT_1510794 [Mycena metata]|uniref:Uncharacterized protein n=1 Tax=Mycena metata TaxID=1033252 RepID=A0AAD7JXS1_9AGAR|nr:hypothetical protein B0H16DRAFT_1510794 [Mycena metata]